MRMAIVRSRLVEKSETTRTNAMLSIGRIVEIIQNAMPESVSSSISRIYALLVPYRQTCLYIPPSQRPKKTQAQHSRIFRATPGGDILIWVLGDSIRKYEHTPNNIKASYMIRIHILLPCFLFLIGSMSNVPFPVIPRITCYLSIAVPISCSIISLFATP